MKPGRQFISRPRSASAPPAQKLVARATNSPADSPVQVCDPALLERAEGRTSRAYLPQLVSSPVPFRRTIRRAELRQIVPLADTTIYEMERRGEFPRRFYITSRCVVWDLEEVEAWIEARRNASNAALLKRAPLPDVRQRKRRPVRGEPAW